LNAPNYVFSRKSVGKLFHTQGPATEKLLSPKVLCVRGTNTSCQWQNEDFVDQSGRQNLRSATDR